MMQFDFYFEMPNGMELLVEASVSGGRPMRYPDLNGPGEPAEDPTLEIGDCHLMLDGKPGPEFETDGFYIDKFLRMQSTGADRFKAMFEKVSLIDAITDAAWRELEDIGE